MNLYLVQHSEAKSKEEDPQRSLSEKGWVDIRKIAKFLSKNIYIQVKTIMHSGKTRAQQTAEVLAQYLNPLEGIQQADGLDPLTVPSIWVERLTKTEEDIMLVGHLPHLSKLSSLLICQDENKIIIDFKNAGVVCLSRNEANIWTVRWILVPNILI